MTGKSVPEGEHYLHSDTDADVEVHAGHSLSSQKRSVTPGPGAYNVRSGFGARASLPGAKHHGTFSMGKKLFEPWSIATIGPDKYQACLEKTKSTKPAWSFPCAPNPRLTSSVVPDGAPQFESMGNGPGGKYAYHSLGGFQERFN